MMCTCIGAAVMITLPTGMSVAVPAMLPMPCMTTSCVGCGALCCGVVRCECGLLVVLRLGSCSSMPSPTCTCTGAALS